MAGRGPAPKDPSERRRRNASETVNLSSDGEIRGPELPDDVEWHAQTREWWQTWRRSAQAKTFTETDWSFLLDTALMHSAMWAKGQWTLAAEVRLRAAKFGATPEDRARLKIAVDSPEVAPPARPARRAASQTTRRAAILRVVDDADGS